MISYFNFNEFLFLFVKRYLSLKKKTYQRFFSCLFLMTFMSGCARENVLISDSFLAKPQTVVIAQLTGLEKPGYYKDGNQGMVDFVISDLMTSSLQEKLKTIETNNIIEKYYYKLYASALEARSFKVLKDLKPINKNGLSDLGESKYAPYDFKFLKCQSGAEFALILNPHAFGIIRPYYGFIPLGAPKGYTRLSVYLVNLSDNSIVGEYQTSVQNKIEGEWDAPPDYTTLLYASKNSLMKALEEAYSFLFQDKTFF